jgi:hypothetical protein
MRSHSISTTLALHFVVESMNPSSLVLRVHAGTNASPGSFRPSIKIYHGWWYVGRPTVEASVGPEAVPALVEALKAKTGRPVNGPRERRCASVGFGKRFSTPHACRATLRLEPGSAFRDNRVVPADAASDPRRRVAVILGGKRPSR